MKPFAIRWLPALLLAAAFAAPATDFAQPRPGLHTGGQPTPDDLAALKQQGVHTVIDLRGAEEDRGFDEAAQAQELGLRYLTLPISGKDSLTPANADALHSMLEEAGDGVLLHCGSGNRVGALLALRAAHNEGLPPEAALKLGRQAGLKSLEPAVAEKLAAPAPDSATPDE